VAEFVEAPIITSAKSKEDGEGQEYRVHDTA
jgi:hypothetical protein